MRSCSSLSSKFVVGMTLETRIWDHCVAGATVQSADVFITKHVYLVVPTNFRHAYPARLLVRSSTIISWECLIKVMAHLFHYSHSVHRHEFLNISRVCVWKLCTIVKSSPQSR